MDQLSRAQLHNPVVDQMDHRHNLSFNRGDDIDKSLQLYEIIKIWNICNRHQNYHIPGGQVHTAASFLDSQLAFGPQGSSKHGSRLHLQNDNIKLQIMY